MPQDSIQWGDAGDRTCRGPGPMPHVTGRWRTRGHPGRPWLAAGAAGAAALLLVASGAAVAQDAAVLSAGQAAYARECARCHTNPAKIGGLAAGLQDAARRSSLLRYLARHHATDPQGRAAIVAWLAEVVVTR
jgi:mono/diheme cytochrome c family protein